MKTTVVLKGLEGTGGSRKLYDEKLRKFYSLQDINRMMAGLWNKRGVVTCKIITWISE
jgi:hypothetical protein